MHDLAASQIWNKGETIIYNDWVGVVRDVFNELTVKFDDGKVMSFQDQEGVVQSIPTSTDSIANYERFDCNPQEVPMDNYHVLTRPRHIGQRIWITKEVFSGSRYLMGFNPEGSFTGLIVHIWCKTMKVDWEFPSVKVSHNDRFIKPPLILISALLESGAVRLYDSSRRPQENDNVAGAPYIGLIPQYVYPSSYVIFKANQKAVDKYGEQMFGHWMSSVLSTPSTTINISERMAIVSEITSTTSWVRVQWQDGSITDECSTSVYPYAETDDHDVWPGELVSLKDQEYTFQDPPFGEMIETCAVGVVQSVNASERTAFVRWYDGVDITITGEEQDEIIRTYSTLGQITGKVTEVSSLELAVHQALNKRVGDIVRISRPDLIPRELANQSSDWYREVIHVSLDGRVSVRLGGLSSVCDITCSILDVAASTDDDTAETIETDTDVIWDRMTRRQTLQTNTDLDASVLSRSDPSHENQQMTENSSDGRSNIESLGQQRNIASAMNAKKRPNNHIDVEAPADTSTLERAKRRQIQSECADPSYRICSAPVSFEILDGMGPFINGLGDKSGKWVQAVFREYRILRKSLPEGVYVRSWNASINMIRVLIVGPSDTPYAYAPFLFDIHLEEKFPNRPPRIFFHSWTRGIGKINPNLYQDGKVCLNLLGTWHSQEDDEGWVPGKSSILQIIVSLLGLVLVKEPYYSKYSLISRPSSLLNDLIRIAIELSQGGVKVCRLRIVRVHDAEMYMANEISHRRSWLRSFKRHSAGKNPSSALFGEGFCALSAIRCGGCQNPTCWLCGCCPMAVSTFCQWTFDVEKHHRGLPDIPPRNSIFWFGRNITTSEGAARKVSYHVRKDKSGSSGPAEEDDGRF